MNRNCLREGTLWTGVSRVAPLRAGWLQAGVALVAIGNAAAQVTIPDANGSDGAFNPTANVTINLALADTLSFANFQAGQNPSPGEGVYIPEQWAIVFRYSSVNIPAGVTVSFANHPANPPVIWLVSGAATINGVVSVDARDATELGFGVPGPGGFRGGYAQSIGGLGPGGAAIAAAATYAGSYGNSRCVPLIGGSGGSASACTAYDGGGGAILIAAPDTITLNGSIVARNTFSNYYCGALTGSGGAVRLVCDRLEGSGSVAANAVGNRPGRIRYECNELSFASVGDPVASLGLPGTTATIWPGNGDPRVTLVSIGGQGVPADPRASFEFPYADVNTSSTGAQTLVIECENIPVGPDPAPWNVRVRIVPRLTGQPPTVIDATYVSGDFTLSTWEAQATFLNGFSAIQVRASMPPP